MLTHSMSRALLFSALLLVSPWLINAPPTKPQTAQLEYAQPVFVLPVKCDIGVSCLIQKLVDHDPGPGRQDYLCGTLTTDGHDGIDIRLRTLADMRAGYGVIASAAGNVLRSRDGEPDISSRVRTDLDGKDAGNGVVIDHGNGWQTQYSHLRQGSVSVHPGQHVAAGDQIGLIGMSGNAEFPHLHFTIRYKGATVDPFVGAGPIGPCNATASPSGLWTPATARALTYVPTAIIASGLASDVPPKSVADRLVPPTLKGSDAPLLMWVDVIGAQVGDVQAFTITGPNGLSVHNQQTTVVGGGLSWFAYSGKRAPATGWPMGRYVGQYTLRRNGIIVAQTQTSGSIP